MDNDWGTCSRLRYGSHNGRNGLPDPLTQSSTQTHTQAFSVRAHVFNIFKGRRCWFQLFAVWLLHPTHPYTVLSQGPWSEEREHGIISKLLSAKLARVNYLGCMNCDKIDFIVCFFFKGQLVLIRLSTRTKWVHGPKWPRSTLLTWSQAGPKFGL